MQKDALEQLRLLREKGKQRGLIISPTGTGKTYLGAFDVKSITFDTGKNLLDGEK